MSDVELSDEFSDSDASSDAGEERKGPGKRARRAAGKPRKDGHPAKDWCVTARSAPDWSPAGPLPDAIAFVAGQQERGKSGFLHWQLFVQLKRKQRFPAVQKLVGDDTAHCEVRKGTPEEARDYCRKDDTYIPGTRFELGQLRHLKSNHMDALKDAIDAGMSIADIADQHFGAWSRSMGAVDRLLQMRAQRQRLTWTMPRVHVYVGDTGTGKSRAAFELVDTAFGGICYRKPDGPWWDGYSDQDCVVLDDFDGGVPLGQLLQLLDGLGHGILLPVKGSHLQCKAKTFIFTSNKLPQEWYPHASDRQKDALRRRITNLKMFDMGGGQQDLKQEGQDWWDDAWQNQMANPNVAAAGGGGGGGRVVVDLVDDE